MKQAPPLQGGTRHSVGDAAIFGVLTVSDRASKGIYDDESGPELLNFFHEAIRSEYVTIASHGLYLDSLIWHRSPPARGCN